MMERSVDAAPATATIAGTAGFSGSSRLKTPDPFWAVVLAGGDGTRLQSVSHRVAGDGRPKQFCNLLGRGSLLSETRTRLSRAVAEEQQLFVVTRSHERWYRDELNDVDASRLLVQPMNRGTGIAIALGILRVMQEDSRATVAVLPSDHYYPDEDAFVSALHAARNLSEAYPDSIVLLGAKATHAEVEYGWIEPGPAISHRACEGAFRVTRFWEKPTPALAEELLVRGCFWNTFVTVGRATTFLDLFRTRVPGTMLRVLMGLSQQDIAGIYDRVQPIDFSRDVLIPLPHRLLTVCDPLCGWLDLGSPARLFDAMARCGIEPQWISESRESLHPW